MRMILLQNRAACCHKLHRFAEAVELCTEGRKCGEEGERQRDRLAAPKGAGERERGTETGRQWQIEGTATAEREEEGVGKFCVGAGHQRTEVCLWVRPWSMVQRLSTNRRRSRCCFNERAVQWQLATTWLHTVSRNSAEMTAYTCSETTPPSEVSLGGGVVCAWLFACLCDAPPSEGLACLALRLELHWEGRGTYSREWQWIHDSV